MAVTGIQLNINSEELRGLADRLRTFFPNKQAADVIAAAIRKAIVPTTKRLREITPVGPTENLRRAVSSKVVKYANTGIAIGLVGYNRAGKAGSSSAAGGTVRAGKDRAFHQWWVEQGTQERRIGKFSATPYQRRSPTKPFVRTRLGKQETVRGKGVVHTVVGQNAYIASSFNRLGPFKFIESADGRMQTEPAYPRAFFKKSRDPIVIPAMPAGGTAGRPPVNTAFLETQDQMAGILQRELSLSLAQAWAALRFRESGTVTGTDTLGPA